MDTHPPIKTYRFGEDLDGRSALLLTPRVAVCSHMQVRYFGYPIDGSCGLAFPAINGEDNELQSEIWVRSSSDLRSWVMGNVGTGREYLGNFVSRKTAGE